MEFLTSSILGGIIYDIAKNNIANFNEKLKNSIKGYIFNDDEIALLNQIANDIIKKDNYTKEDFIKTISSNQKIQHIIQKLEEKKISINNIQNNNGIVMGDNHGTINFSKNG